MPTDYDYFVGRRTDRTYISKSFRRGLFGEGPKLRILSKVFDMAEPEQFVQIKDEVVVRVTPKERYQIKAVFYEDSRQINRLTIQRFITQSGKPQKEYSFNFTEDELKKILNLIRTIQYIRLSGDAKVIVDDDILDELLITEEQKRNFLIENFDLVEEIAKSDITKSDVLLLDSRRKQVEIFEKLLRDETFFETKRKEWGKAGHEAVWQQFFEDNPWIFGYGLNYIVVSGLDERRLEQVTSGFSFAQPGKRVDALMKTRGLISSLCFVEIKTHSTKLLFHDRPYRSGCWQVSNELSGSIAQIQKTVQMAISDLQTKLELPNIQGDLTGELAFLYQPKAYVVIGNLGEFITDDRINEQKFSSFELFRRNIANPEIITFDELFERAKFIAHYSDHDLYIDSVQDDFNRSLSEDEIPF